MIEVDIEVWLEVAVVGLWVRLDDVAVLGVSSLRSGLAHMNWTPECKLSRFEEAQVLSRQAVVFELKFGHAQTPESHMN